MNKHGRRRGYLINRRYQLKYVMSFVGIALVALLTSTVLILDDITRQIDEYIARPAVDISSTGDIVLPVVLRVSIGVTLGYLLVLAVATLYYMSRTKKLVGSIGEGIRRFRQGELGFQFRVSECSDFGKTEDALNAMLAANRERVAGLRSMAEDIDRELAGLDGMDAGEVARDGRLRPVEGMLDKLDGMLSHYRVG
ncbi:MAG TPA: hypothetical protein VGB23_00015 [Nitrospirota bacterium]